MLLTILLTRPDLSGVYFGLFTNALSSQCADRRSVPSKYRDDTSCLNQVEPGRGRSIAAVQGFYFAKGPGEYANKILLNEGVVRCRCIC